MARKLTFEKTQNRSALSEKDVKLVELRQQLTCVNTTPQRAAAEVCATSFNVGVITVNLHNKWRRSVVKYWGWGGGGVMVSQVKPSNCFRRLEKLVLPSIFDTSK